MQHYHPNTALKLEIQMTEERIRRTGTPGLLETPLIAWLTRYRRQAVRQIEHSGRALMQALFKMQSTHMQSSPVTMRVTGRK